MSSKTASTIDEHKKNNDPDPGGRTWTRKRAIMVAALITLSVVVVVAIVVPLSTKDGSNDNISSSSSSSNNNNMRGSTTSPTFYPTSAVTSITNTDEMTDETIFWESNTDEASSFLADPAFMDNEFYMVNVLAYREQAVYKDGRETNLTGYQANQIYGAYVLPELTKIGAQIVFQARIERDAQSNKTSYTDVTVVRYPNSTAFVQMTSQPEFQEKLEHKEAALSINLVMACERLPSPYIPPRYESDNLTSPSIPSSLYYIPANETNPEVAQVNIFDFRELAQYQDSDVDADNTRTGEEAYNMYSTNAGPLVMRAGVRNIAHFKVQAVMIGQHIGYEEIRINWFPSNETWKQVIDDPTRQSYGYHRYAGMEEESLFFKSTPIHVNVFLEEYYSQGSSNMNSSTTTDSTTTAAACYICGDDSGTMSNPSASITIPGSSSSSSMIQCSQIDAAGRSGMIPTEQCTTVTSFAAGPCGCV